MCGTGFLFVPTNRVCYGIEYNTKIHFASHRAKHACIVCMELTVFIGSLLCIATVHTLFQLYAQCTTIQTNTTTLNFESNFNLFTHTSCNISSFFSLIRQTATMFSLSCSSFDSTHKREPLTINLELNVDFSLVRTSANSSKVCDVKSSPAN